MQVSSDDVDEDDTWDDSVLVDAYDKAVGLAMKEVQRRMEQGHSSDDQEMGSKKKTKKKRSSEKNKSNEGPTKVTLIYLLKSAPVYIYIVLFVNLYLLTSIQIHKVLAC